MCYIAYRELINKDDNFMTVIKKKPELVWKKSYRFLSFKDIDPRLFKLLKITYKLFIKSLTHSVTTCVWSFRINLTRNVGASLRNRNNNNAGFLINSFTVTIK